MVARLLRTAELIVVVTASRHALGVWPTSVIVAVVGLWWGLRAWHRMETRSRRRPATIRRAQLPVASGHVAFAQALLAVADAYLSACEEETDLDGPH